MARQTTVLHNPLSLPACSENLEYQTLDSKLGQSTTGSKNSALPGSQPWDGRERSSRKQLAHHGADALQNLCQTI